MMMPLVCQLLPVPATTLPVVGSILGALAAVIEGRIEVVQQVVGAGGLAEEGPAQPHGDRQVRGDLEIVLRIGFQSATAKGWA